jgi:hypothetical protein
MHTQYHHIHIRGARIKHKHCSLPMCLWHTQAQYTRIAPPPPTHVNIIDRAPTCRHTRYHYARIVYDFNTHTCIKRHG